MLVLHINGWSTKFFLISPLIRKMMEVYVDNMIAKSIKETNHVRDLEETFKILKSYAMKVNPKKCKFSVRSEKFLGCMIDH